MGYIVNKFEQALEGGPQVNKIEQVYLAWGKGSQSGKGDLRSDHDDKIKL